MNKTLQLLLGLALVAAVACHSYPEEEDVIVLTDDNFDAVLREFPSVLVEFYAPWCGHCKKLAPEYSRAAAILKNSDPFVPLAKLDATVHKQAAEKFQIQGFPTLKFFVNGEAVQYNGGRTEKEIVSWVNKRAGKVSTFLADAEAVKNFVDSNDVAIVYFGESEDDAEFTTFKTVAMNYDDLAFGHTTDESARTANSARNRQIVLFKKFDERRNEYSGLSNAQDVKAFVEENSFATVMPFNDRAIEKVFQKGNPTIFLFSDDNEASVAAESIFAEVAKAQRGNGVLFSISKPNDGFGHFNRLAEYVGADVSNCPQLMLVHTTDGVNKYKYTASSVNSASLVQFVNDFKAHQLEKYLQSQDIPATNDEPVQVIVGQSFNDIVINNDKDVLVEFYAPWCGHCKQLAPIYDELAQKLASNPNVVIAQCDSTANEVPSVNIRGFPTLKFWKNGQKGSPIDYEGERDLKGLTEFIKKHTSHPWTHDDL